MFIQTLATASTAKVGTGCPYRWFWKCFLTVLYFTTKAHACFDRPEYWMRSCWNADHADWGLQTLHTVQTVQTECYFLLVPHFSSKIFTIVSCFLSLCALCITIICCTDVYLPGSWVGNEKITGSWLPADVKAVSLAFSCAAFTQERARWRKVSCFFL